MTSKDTSTDIIQQVDTELLFGDRIIEIETSDEAQRAIVQRILEADDLAGLFPDSATTPTRDLVGIPLKVTDVTLRESSIEDKPGVYLVFHGARLDTGETVVVNTSAVQIIATLARAKVNGGLPIEVQVRELGLARPGRSAPLGLEPIGNTLAQIQEAIKTGE